MFSRISNWMSSLLYKKTHINDLPPEILVEILLQTDGRTIGTCREVCLYWKYVIDTDDLLWENICKEEYELPSKVVKEKLASNCRWYHIYKNFVMWNRPKKFDARMTDFHDFRIQNAVEARCYNSIEALREEFSHITSLLDRNCSKIANNKYALVIFYKLMLVIVRPSDMPGYKTLKYHKADGFTLYRSKLYYYLGNQIFVCDLTLDKLESEFLQKCDDEILSLHHYDGETHAFLKTGSIVTISFDTVTNQNIKCPDEWIMQIKHVAAINDKNYICISPNLFLIETNKYKHLYLVFPKVTAIFFYGDFAIIGTRLGYICLYRLSEQRGVNVPMFDPIAHLPEGHFAVHIDVVERRCGPLIIVVTLFKIIFIELDFFPHEKLEDDEIPLIVKRLKSNRKLLSLKDESEIQANERADDLKAEQTLLQQHEDMLGDQEWD